MKPVIGVMPLVDEKKDSLWMLPGYMDGISAAGGIPVMFPITEKETDIAELICKVDGILLTGGHDVDPAIYGEEAINSSVVPCIQRDRMESEVVRQAIDKDMPVLGICRGIQFLNAFLGGTLYQDIPEQHPSDVNHHQTPPYDVPVHEVNIVEGSSLFKLFNATTVSVNSYHHQAVKELSKSLKAMAISTDGLVEAAEMVGKKFIWAVQWHPEFSYRSDENSMKIFREFVKNCYR